MKFTTTKSSTEKDLWAPKPRPQKPGTSIISLGGPHARRVLARNCGDDTIAQPPTLGGPGARGRKLGTARLRRGHAGGAPRAWLGPEAPEGDPHHPRARRSRPGAARPLALLRLLRQGRRRAANRLRATSSRGRAAGSAHRSTPPALP